jgi:hypothetical protein
MKRFYPEIFVALLLLLIGGVAIASATRRHKDRSVGYRLIVDRVRFRFSDRKLKDIIPKNEIRITKEKDRVTTFWGWVVSAGSDGVSTQWFRLDGALNNEGELDQVYDLRLFVGPPPAFTNSPPATNSGAPLL